MKPALCVCVGGCVRVAPSSWVTFVGQGVAGQITDYCELFVYSVYLSAWMHFIRRWHTPGQFVQVKFNSCRWWNNEHHHTLTVVFVSFAMWRNFLAIVSFRFLLLKCQQNNIRLKWVSNIYSLFQLIHKWAQWVEKNHQKRRKKRHLSVAE